MHLKKAIELTPKNFVSSKKIVHPVLKDKKGMVAFLAGWCGHCNRFAPVYESVSENLGTSFPMFYFDCEKYSDFASKKLKISGFPTVKYINRKGEMDKDYNQDRSQIAMIQDICKESQVCH